MHHKEKSIGRTSSFIFSLTHSFDKHFLSASRPGTCSGIATGATFPVSPAVSIWGNLEGVSVGGRTSGSSVGAGRRRPAM